MSSTGWGLGPGLTDLIRDQDTLDMGGPVLINASVEPMLAAADAALRPAFTGHKT